MSEKKTFSEFWEYRFDEVKGIDRNDSRELDGMLIGRDEAVAIFNALHDWQKPNQPACDTPLNIAAVVRIAEELESIAKAFGRKSEIACGHEHKEVWDRASAFLYRRAGRWRVQAQELEKEGGETKPAAGIAARRILDRAVIHGDMTTTNEDGQTVDGIAFNTLERIVEEELGEQPAPACDICEDTGEVPYYDLNGDEMDKRPCPHCKP